MRESGKWPDMIEPRNVADELRESVGAWLNAMGAGLSPGRFRFCKRGSLVPVDGKRGMATTCLAAKSAWHIGSWEHWQPEIKEGCLQFIKSFQCDDGNFVDKWLLNKIGRDTRLVLARRGRLMELFKGLQDSKEMAVRAETRQSAATLLQLGDQPVYPLPMEWRSEAAVRDFVRSLDWSLPWHAGSHTSHLVSFIVMNEGLSESAPPASNLLDAAFDEASRFLDPATGTWGIGDVGPAQRINGAMKMLTAYDWAGGIVPDPERIIDYTLNEASDEDGCGVLDKLFVLHQAGLGAPGYRQSDLERIALEALDDICSYRQTDGAFSFSRERAQRAYYGAVISLGGRQSDMHGTVMFTWACAVALDLLGIRKEADWQLSKP